MKHKFGKSLAAVLILDCLRVASPFDD